MTWRAPGSPSEPDLGGSRARALLLVKVVAPPPNEIAALIMDQVAEHPTGPLLTIPRSKTTPTGEHVHFVVLPRAGKPDRCPVRPHLLVAPPRRHRRTGLPRRDQSKLRSSTQPEVSTRLVRNGLRWAQLPADRLSSGDWTVQPGQDTYEEDLRVAQYYTAT